MNADKIHETALAYALDPTEDKMETAVLAALPLAHAIAHRFAGRGIELEDLRQVAAMALVSALKGFDPTRGLRFTTYVTPTITGTVRNFIRDKAQILRSPRSLREQGVVLERAVDQLTQERHREPSVHELAEHLDWSIDKVLATREARDKTILASLDAPDDEGFMLLDVVGEADSGFESLESHEDLRQALEHLSDAEMKLIRLRFQDRLSQQMTAQEMNMTQMQVSRMERRVIKTLRHLMQAG